MVATLMCIVGVRRAQGVGAERFERQARGDGAEAAPPPSLRRATSSAPAKPAPWIQRSNENAQLLLDVMAKFAPEAAGRFGVSGLDEQVFDLTPGYEERANVAIQGVIETYRAGSPPRRIRR